MEAAKLSVANVAEAFSLFVTFLARLMMVGNVSNVGDVTGLGRWPGSGQHGQHLHRINTFRASAPAHFVLLLSALYLLVL